MYQYDIISPGCYECLSAVQDLDEGLAELDVEGCVDDGVDGAVQVAQPGHGTVERGRDAAAAAVGLQHVGEEEGKPANDEHACWEQTQTGRRCEDGGRGARGRTVRSAASFAISCWRCSLI